MYQVAVLDENGRIIAASFVDDAFLPWVEQWIKTIVMNHKEEMNNRQSDLSQKGAT